MASATCRVLIDSGHGDLPIGGRLISPLVVKISPLTAAVLSVCAVSLLVVGGVVGLAGRDSKVSIAEAGVKGSEEIMEILEAYDLTGSLRGAAALARCDDKTVAHYVGLREAGLRTSGRRGRC